MLKIWINQPLNYETWWKWKCALDIEVVSWKWTEWPLLCYCLKYTFGKCYICIYINVNTRSGGNANVDWIWRLFHENEVNADLFLTFWHTHLVVKHAVHSVDLVNLVGISWKCKGPLLFWTQVWWGQIQCSIGVNHWWHAQWISWTCIQNAINDDWFHLVQINSQLVER